MKLTNREQEILYMLALGMSCQDTSVELQISIRTVQTHTQRLFAKLGARNRANAIALYMQSLSPSQQALMQLRHDWATPVRYSKLKRVK